MIPEQTPLTGRSMRDYERIETVTVRIHMRLVFFARITVGNWVLKLALKILGARLEVIE